MTTAELLAYVQEAISNRLQGISSEEWSDGALRYKSTPFMDLRLYEERLLKRQAAEGGGNFKFAAFRRR